MRACKGSLVTFTEENVKRHTVGTSPAVQWLRLRASNIEGRGSIPGGRTKIPHASLHGQKKKKKRERERHTAEFPWASLISVSLKCICCLSFLYFVKYLCSANKIHLLQKISLVCVSYSQWTPAWSRKLRLSHGHCHLNQGGALSSEGWCVKNRSGWQRDGVSRPC